MSKRASAIYYRRVIEVNGGKVQSVIQQEQVFVLAKAEGYAMVRHAGCMPFVCRISELSAPREK